MDNQRLRCFRVYRKGEIDENTPVMLGIDEAGRGPVLGPMVYGGFYCAIGEESQNILKKKIRVDDSKKLTEASREQKFQLISSSNYKFGTVANVITPEYISYRMLWRDNYNLNDISHDTAISIIRHVIGLKINLQHVHVDTVGMASKYEAKLKSIFPHFKITVAEKADSLYPCVSAASIVAKVVRDNIIKSWHPDTQVGSGYPTDPATVKYLKDKMDKVFGFPNFVRFSWATASNILNAKQDGALLIDWHEYDEVDKDALLNKPQTNKCGVPCTIERISAL